MELENSNCINFLDATVIRKEGFLVTTVYRKDCNIQHFVPVNSNHPWAQKKSAIEHAFRRAFKYCSTPELYTKEETKIFAMFENNGYNTHAIAEIRHRVKEKLRRDGLEGLPAPGEAGPHDQAIKVGIPYFGPWNKRLLTLGL